MRNHRFLNSHIVNPANDRLCITVLDEPGAGGANHLYMISGFDTSTNPAKLIADEMDGEPVDLAIKQSGAVPLIFQNGAIGEAGLNGITHEALLAILIDRLESFQTGPYKSNYNADALYHLQAAMDPRPDGAGDRRHQWQSARKAFKVREALEDLDKQERDDAAYDRSTEAQADAQKLKDHWESKLTEARTQTTEWPHDRSTDGIAAAIENATLGDASAQRQAADVEPILKFFAFEHLPEHLQSISKNFSMLAHDIIHTLPCNAERSVALRKLLEAKDAAVRAAL